MFSCRSLFFSYFNLRLDLKKLDDRIDDLVREPRGDSAVFRNDQGAKGAKAANYEGAKGAKGVHFRSI